MRNILKLSDTGIPYKCAVRKTAADLAAALGYYSILR